MSLSKFLVLGPLLHTSLVLCQGISFGPTIAEISPQWNNVFPAPDFNRNVSVPFWETTFLEPGRADAAAESQLNRFDNISFIVYDSEMYKLLNVSSYKAEKKLETIFEFPAKPSYATRMIHDATVYVPEVNAVFFAELYSPKPGYSMQPMSWVWKIDLTHRPTTSVVKVYPNPPLTIANGAYYHDGYVYWAQEGNWTVPGGIVRMDPRTLETKVVKNNFYTHRFNSPNDIVITNAGAVFFTDGYYGHDNFNDSLIPQLANGVYRWDMNTGNVKMVAGAADGAFFNPNGLTFNSDQSKLYITNRGNSSDDADGGRTIFSYDVTPSGIAHREIFAYTDAGFPDGIKTDKDGRVYGCVTGSVDIFNKNGTLIGRIKVANGDVAVNLAWVENWLYIVGRNYAYRVQLATTQY